MVNVQWNKWVCVFGMLLAGAAHADSSALAEIVDERVALTGNNTRPSDWRLGATATFNGVKFDGVARLRYTDSAGDGWACSGTLLAGGAYVLTAAHCADDFVSMKVDFGYYNGVATESRTASVAYLHQGWTGALGQGSDIALLKLDAPVTNIQGFKLSTTNDVGKNFLMMGYGTTSVGNSDAATSWADGAWGHWGMNTIDVTNKALNTAIWGNDPNDDRWGTEYVADFDSLAFKNRHNTLGILAGLTGGGWTSGTGLGDNEALIAGGDSGGGDFVWNGTEWLLTGVHSWGWQICPASLACDYSASNASSWGDLMGSTAVFSHEAWINSVVTAVPVPEPETYALMLAGLGIVAFSARRRKPQA